MKLIYLVRHCEASGQSFESRLTEKGKVQAKELRRFFEAVPLERIICSPYKRTEESCKEISESKNIHIEHDTRLKERVLSKVEIPDWKEKLYQSFLEPNMKLTGGESSFEAAQRGIAVIKDVLEHEVATTLIVTHGNLMALILNYFDNSYGFETWRSLTNPDVYCLVYDKNQMNIERIWEQK